jgi:hypothetical protein
MAAASNRELVRTVVLALLGLLFFATAIVAVVGSILHAPRCTAGPMLNAVLATLGVFVVLAARNPPAHRSLILFAAWSSFAHAAMMLVIRSRCRPSRRCSGSSLLWTGSSPLFMRGRIGSVTQPRLSVAFEKGVGLAARAGRELRCSSDQ